MTSAFCQPPPCDAERERIRELARYYCLVDHPPPGPTTQKSPQHDEQPDDKPRLSSDITLTALAQLGVLRFDCNRSFVSIIDGSNQHIIAEATASISLRDINKHDPNDGIYLGARTLDLVWGVCPHTIKLFTGQDPSYAINTENVTANSSRYIIRDFTREDCFKDRPYVVGWPHMRFYAEVPLRTPGGCVLGSYCVVDDKPRSQFGDSEISSLQEVADAIADHLETIRISHCHRRTETLVKSLTSFVKDHAEFDPTEAYKPALTQPPIVAPGEALTQQNICNTEDQSVDPVSDSSVSEPAPNPLAPGQQSPSVSTGELSSLFSKAACSDHTEISSSLKGIERNIPSIAPGNLPQVNLTGADNLPVNDEPSTPSPRLSLAESDGISSSIAKIFSRASMLLRDSMDLEGVLFLDACHCNSGVVLTGNTGTWEPLPSTANPEFFVDPYSSPLEIPGVGSLSNASHKACTYLGTALRSSIGCSESNLGFTEELLDVMISSFPQGQIFNLKEYVEDSQRNRNELSPDEERDPVQETCRRLLFYLPEAHCVLFCPLWDWNKSRWLAGTLVWTKDSYRALGSEELHYFKAFGDSIISEVARADWATTQKSKSDFMSSVSHELRSPLHGILASAELLAAASLPPTQRNLVKMVETCGLTLLDTLNHLLDFSKINNLTTSEDLEKGCEGSGNTTGLTTVFDLDSLIDEVVNVQYIGRKLPESAAHLARQTPPEIRPTNPTENDDGELTVVIRIEEPHTWKLRSVSGAWRRIVMNLLGNALKWTKTGFVEVSLSKVRRRSDRVSTFAQLSVTDTGRGITPDFLKHKLFSPFAQESTLSEGLGLGLSIVHQLVTSLDGHINVRSEVGVGTQVDIYIPVEIFELSAPNPISNPLSPPERMRACLVGFTGHPDLKDPPTGILPPEAKRKLAIRSCLTTSLADSSNWTLSLAESIDQGCGDVAIIEEAQFNELLINGQLSPATSNKKGFRFFIVLESMKSALSPYQSPNVIRVSQPFGFSKFEAAILKIRDLEKQPICDPVTPTRAAIALPTPLIPMVQTIPSTVVVGTREKEISGTSTCSSSAFYSLPQKDDSIKPHLLIVDDNDINLKILVTFARKIGCSYDTACDGLKALDKYKASGRRYDLVLMDISMPVMDGIVSTTKIRHFEKASSLSPAKIMAVTGVASAEMQQRAQAAGIDDYLVKPVSLQVLKKVIASL